MPFENYEILLAVLAVIYSGVARFIQIKLMNKAEMDAVQAESKRLNDEYKAADKAHDKAKMDRLMKEQMDLFPRMNKVLLSQFKPMIVILVIFFFVNWAITTYDPSKLDDVTLMAHINGSGNGTYIAYYTFNSTKLNGTNYGKWVASATAFDGTADIADNSTYFLYNVDNTTDTFLLAPKGQPMAVSTDKQVYYPGDTLEVMVTPPPSATAVNVTLNMGTSFYVDLPFTIPLVNVQRLHEPYWWFIFVTLIAGIIISIAYSMLTQKKGATK
jgi:uncharacterized membrane protein (DUF106 family)